MICDLEPNKGIVRFQFLVLCSTDVALRDSNTSVLILFVSTSRIFSISFHLSVKLFRVSSPSSDRVSPLELVI